MPATSQQGTHAWWFFFSPAFSAVLEQPLCLPLSVPSGTASALPCSLAAAGTKHSKEETMSSFQREDQRLKSALQACLQPHHRVIDTMGGVKFCSKMDTQQWVQGKI